MVNEKPDADLWAGFSPKLVALLGIFAAEKFLVLHLPPGWMLSGVHWLGGTPIVFSLSLLFFSRRKSSLIDLQYLPVDYRFVFLHVVALIAIIVLRFELPPSHYSADSLRFQAIATLWTGLLIVAIFSLIAAFIPWRRQWRIAWELGFAWIYALSCTAAVVIIRSIGDSTWDAASSPLGRFLHQACFRQTQWLLHVFYPLVLADPERHLLGTTTFMVRVSWLCSGIEGLVLVAVFIVAWLIYARRELRIDRAILLLPLALVVTWYLNIVRLTALIAMGNAGHGEIAAQGFHAQAGWITLNLIALSFLLLVQRVRWFRKTVVDERRDAHRPTRTDTEGSPSPNFAVIYLLPFSAIVVASLITQAVSSGFEWLYPLRFLVGLIALWVFRKDYRALNWRFGWMGIVAGLAVAGMWMGLHFAVVHGEQSRVATAVGLAKLSALPRYGWIGIRILAAVITVPIAEELAFRGFLARRTQSADFQELPFARLGAFPLILSSVAFGAMHGKMWIAGTIAGLVFGLVAKMRNRMGEAVAAHATANLAIAMLALVRNDYSLW
ncbi:MAG: exosortase E/protease, VPEID-CTERM system [Acidobacteria bacterium]|nr:exosortase E/protease, VPEID-CTERM system [Acidobacteriota bacterium]